MSELIERDPQLSAVVDKKSGRNLLDPSNPSPLSVDLSAGKPQRFSLQVNNGPEGLIDLAIAADQGWLQPETTRLTLVGGETGECIITARPDGSGEFGSLLFSWEGTASTLSRPVMVMRLLAAGAAAPPPDAGKPPQPPRAPERSQAVKTLEKFIDGCGGNDKFIDFEEEQSIFRKGGALELSLTEVEAVLNRKCSDGGWTRQTRLTEKLTAMLKEATADDGVIDQGELDHVVNFAVKRRMPRRDSEEHCITLILNNAWKPKESMLNKWFTKKRKQYGL